MKKYNGVLGNNCACKLIINYINNNNLLLPVSLEIYYIQYCKEINKIVFLYFDYLYQQHSGSAQTIGKSGSCCIQLYSWNISPEDCWSVFWELQINSDL